MQAFIWAPRAARTLLLYTSTQRSHPPMHPTHPAADDGGNLPSERAAQANQPLCTLHALQRYTRGCTQHSLLCRQPVCEMHACGLQQRHVQCKRVGVVSGPNLAQLVVAACQAANPSSHCCRGTFICSCSGCTADPPGGSCPPGSPLETLLRRPPGAAAPAPPASPSPAAAGA